MRPEDRVVASHKLTEKDMKLEGTTQRVALGRGAASVYQNYLCWVKM